MVGAHPPANYATFKQSPLYRGRLARGLPEHAPGACAMHRRSQAALPIAAVAASLSSFSLLRARLVA